MTAAKVTPTLQLISVLPSHAYPAQDKRAPPEHITTRPLFRVIGVSLAVYKPKRLSEATVMVPHYASY